MDATGIRDPLWTTSNYGPTISGFKIATTYANMPGEKREEITVLRLNLPGQAEKKSERNLLTIFQQEEHSGTGHN